MISTTSQSHEFGTRNNYVIALSTASNTEFLARADTTMPCLRTVAATYLQRDVAEQSVKVGGRIHLNQARYIYTFM